MTKKQRAAACEAALQQQYPDARCSLTADNALQLLIATRLSAQCTDARVNLVTPALFARFPDAQAFAAATPEEVGEYIRSCGLYKTKARDLVALCQKILSEFDGKVPDTMEGLLSLPGVGRKTANLIMGDVYGQPAVVTDTHFLRICLRLGLTDTKDPYKAELQMKKLLTPEGSSDFCHRIVLFGREFCTARAPRCSECPLRELCKSKQ
ncbi:MAG: endonuclease III [Clostridia bacterium]|nr:endonuclease III [Clostridia bacterium]